jgi:Flp pilus assembly pilin Flp
MNLSPLLHSLAARIRNDDKGALLAEYGLLAVGIAMVVAAIVLALGQAVLGLYDLPSPF